MEKIDIPYIIHAAHSMTGLIFKRRCGIETFVLADEAKYFADELKADKIIFHPGIDGELKNNTSNKSN